MVTKARDGGGANAAMYEVKHALPAPPAVFPRKAREHRKLTHRHRPAGSPLRGSASALSIRTYRPLTRAPSSGPSCVLTHRHHPALVASESPHDSSPLRGKSCAFGQTGLQPSPVFTPAGQRMRAVHTHLQPSCVLYIVHEQLPRSCLGPSCVLYIVHGRR